MCSGKGVAGSKTTERGNRGSNCVLMTLLSVAAASRDAGQAGRAEVGGDRGYDQLMTLKLKRTPGLYLVGFMGAGKTTVGRVLADELGWCFVDLDSDIEAREGKRIAEIFWERGESYFRELESEMIRSRVSLIEAGDPCVMALGGGAFVQSRNWELIQNNGVTVWLDCELETIRQRLGEDMGRPLAQDRGALPRLFEERRPLYARADFRVEVDTADVGEVVRKILALPIF
jgi:shikimate kinase